MMIAIPSSQAFRLLLIIQIEPVCTHLLHRLLCQSRTIDQSMPLQTARKYLTCKSENQLLEPKKKSYFWGYIVQKPLWLDRLLQIFRATSPLIRTMIFVSRISTIIIPKVSLTWPNPCSNPHVSSTPAMRRRTGACDAAAAVSLQQIRKVPHQHKPEASAHTLRDRRVRLQRPVSGSHSR